ncbi:MAG: MFS family permease, partial [Gammaproteobacteria bacterium]
VIRRPGLRRVLIVLIMVGWTFGAVFTFYQPWALTQGFAQVSTYLIAYALAAMFVRVGLGGLADRLGRLRVAQAALLLYVCAPFALIWLDFFGLLLTGALLGLAHGMFYPALNAVAVDYALESQRGKAMGAIHGAFNIGFAAGSYLLGMLAITTSYPTVFTVAGMTCFLAFLLLLGAPKTTLEASH